MILGRAPGSQKSGTDIFMAGTINPSRVSVNGLHFIHPLLYGRLSFLIRLSGGLPHAVTFSIDDVRGGMSRTQAGRRFMSEILQVEWRRKPKQTLRFCCNYGSLRMASTICRDYLPFCSIEWAATSRYVS
jgi:hypothetical protein